MRRAAEDPAVKTLRRIVLPLMIIRIFIVGRIDNSGAFRLPDSDGSAFFGCEISMFEVRSGLR